ncbi:MAG TPA: 3'-5' exonuclease [Saprospiraceae bacterium]|nr:3'-5' exonuclease [Saprospiraceae bacterium]HPQ21243.1 3'-5' exonuclease [Saprospiraceae bacterium]HRX30016.1 3'-5' exonuclease [Saprospiraceae bacterium]
MILENVDHKNILFIDIETVPGCDAFESLPEELQALWLQKSKYLTKENEEDNHYSDRAGIYAEFGKIICISVGYISQLDSGEKGMRLKSFYGDDEKEVLQDFSNLITKHYNNPSQCFICGHNIKEFDIPYICRRMLIHRLAIPSLLNISGKKPWEVKYLLDTLELWKFGDFKHYTSLNLLAAIFNIPSPKDDIDGSMVRDVYYEENDLERIVTYCEKDVVTVANVLLSMDGADTISYENVVSATMKE